MSSTDQALIETVAAVRSLLERTDEKAANDPIEITNYIQDEANHMAMKDVDEKAVKKALKVVIKSEIPPYVEPEGEYPMKRIFKTGKPISKLTDYKKYKPAGVHHGQGGEGSKGSYIIALESSDIESPYLVVLKESNLSTPSEVFASKVMRKMGLVSPDFLPLSLDEFKELVMKLRDAQVTVPGTCSAIHDPSAQEHGGVLMDFVSGSTLLDSKPESFNRPKVLRDIGRCMAVDMALNCFDRIPIVWSNNGNPSNIMFSATEVHIIDSAYNRVLDPKMAEVRAEKVRACVIEAKSGVLGEHAEIVRSFFENSTTEKIKLSDDQMKTIFKALYEACEELG